jgi:hypothetical protein
MSKNPMDHMVTDIVTGAFNELAKKSGSHAHLHTNTPLGKWAVQGANYAAPAVVAGAAALVPVALPIVAATAVAYGVYKLGEWLQRAKT